VINGMPHKDEANHNWNANKPPKTKPIFRPGEKYNHPDIASDKCENEACEEDIEKIPKTQATGF